VRINFEKIMKTKILMLATVIDHPDEGVILWRIESENVELEKSQFIEEFGNHPEWIVGMVKFYLKGNRVYLGVNVSPSVSPETQKGVIDYCRVLSRSISDELAGTFDDNELISRGQNLFPPLRKEKCPMIRKGARKIVKEWRQNNLLPKGAK
jgi:hypothetical protein